MRTGISVRISLAAAISAFVSLAGGCAPHEPLGNLTQSSVVSNGFTLNGFTLNGFTLNGFTLNGFTLNGFTLNGTLFSAATSEGPSVAGTDLIGAQAQLSMLPPGQAQALDYTLRFDNIYLDTSRPEGDVYLYDISVAQSGSSTWSSLCTDSAGAPVPAIPIRNYWDTQTGARIDNPNVVTFACASGALGKCVRLGYRPWAQATRCIKDKESCSTISLGEYHQACTRMIRADYCGNGTSYTLNGTQIEVYDQLSPAVQSNTMNWSIEGQWNPGGAFCLGDARHSELLSKGKYPDCNGDGKPGDVPKCGSNTQLKNALLGSTWSGAN